MLDWVIGWSFLGSICWVRTDLRSRAGSYEAWMRSFSAGEFRLALRSRTERLREIGEQTSDRTVSKRRPNRRLGACRNGAEGALGNSAVCKITEPPRTKITHSYNCMKAGLEHRPKNGGGVAHEPV